MAYFERLRYDLCLWGLRSAGHSLMSQPAMNHQRKTTVLLNAERLILTERLFYHGVQSKSPRQSVPSVWPFEVVKKCCFYIFHIYICNFLSEEQQCLGIWGILGVVWCLFLMRFKPSLILLYKSFYLGVNFRMTNMAVKYQPSMAACSRIPLIWSLFFYCDMSSATLILLGELLILLCQAPCFLGSPFAVWMLTIERHIFLFGTTYFPSPHLAQAYSVLKSQQAGLGSVSNNNVKIFWHCSNN